MVKEASGDLELFSSCVQKLDHPILSGDDATFLPSLAVGGQGCISVVSNLFPKIVKKMYSNFVEGDLVSSLQIHNALFPLIQGLSIETNPCPVKFCLEELNLIEGNFRLPLAEISQKNKARLSEIIDRTISAFEQIEH